MRFQNLDLNLLVALDALLRECSISRAAEQLHMSQPAMSSALARLVGKGLPVTLFALPAPALVLEQVQQWHRHRTRDPGLVWVRGLLHAAAARMDAAEPDQSLAD